MTVARRVLGEGHRLTLTMRWNYAQTLCENPCATLKNLRESVTTFEEVKRTMRRVLGGTHPDTMAIEIALRQARAKLGAREEAAPDDVSSVCKGVAAMRTPGDA